MTTTPTTSGGGTRSRAARLIAWAGRAARGLTLRAYALALIAIIGYTSYRAFRYLAVSLMVSAPPPAQVTQWPRRLDTTTLETNRHAWAGLETVEHARAPLAHYHRLDTWIQPDRANNCTTSGCHPALPHAGRKETRAFLNMHATSIHCGVCHLQSESRPLGVTWYDPATGEKRGTPSVLAAHSLLLDMTAPRHGARDAEADRRRLIELLREADTAAQNGKILNTLADHLAGTTSGSDEYTGMINTALEVVPHFFRGEYGAKLALVDGASRSPVLAHPGVESHVRRYVAERDRLDDAAKAALLAEIHPLRRPQTLQCSDCHAPSGLIDFTSLGYSAKRTADLTGSIVVRMIQHISEGSPFYLPRFMRPRDDASGAAPPADAAGANPPGDAPGKQELPSP